MLAFGPSEVVGEIVHRYDDIGGTRGVDRQVQAAQADELLVCGSVVAGSLSYKAIVEIVHLGGADGPNVVQ